MSETVGKVIKCKAAVAWAKNEPLVIEDIEVAPPKAGEVRVRIVATGVCHSDAHTLHGLDSEKNGGFPVILGHEGAGIVESVGEGVTKFQPGDHVIPLFIPECTECKFCKSPKTNICQKLRITQGDGVMPDGTSRFTCKGQTISHYRGTSTFSEYTVVADISLCKIDKAAPLDKVCLMGCAIPTGYGAVVNTAKVEPGSTVAIWGLGAIGMSVAVGCKVAGASKIIGIDINSEKFEVGATFGCTDFVNPKDHEKPIQQVLAEMTGGGPDFTFECCGNVKTMQQALESCHKGWGVTTVVGLAAAGTMVSVHPLLLLSGCVLKGTAFGGWKTASSIPKLVDLYMEKVLMIDEFITHTMPLEKINDGFDLMAAGKSIRSVVHMPKLHVKNKPISINSNNAITKL